MYLFTKMVCTSECRISKNCTCTTAYNYYELGENTDCFKINNMEQEITSYFAISLILFLPILYFIYAKFRVWVYLQKKKKSFDTGQACSQPLKLLGAAPSTHACQGVEPRPAGRHVVSLSLCSTKAIEPLHPEDLPHSAQQSMAVCSQKRISEHSLAF